MGILFKSKVAQYGATRFLFVVTSQIVYNAFVLQTAVYKPSR